MKDNNKFSSDVRALPYEFKYVNYMRNKLKWRNYNRK